MRQDKGQITLQDPAYVPFIDWSYDILNFDFLLGAARKIKNLSSKFVNDGPLYRVIGVNIHNAEACNLIPAGINCDMIFPSINYGCVNRLKWLYLLSRAKT